MIPEYLNKVSSDKKALEVAAILDTCHPTHSERLWLCGFLKYVGYSMDEVTGIISEHCQWSDYSECTTAYQVGTIFHQRPQRTQNHSAPRPKKWALSDLEILRIRFQRSVALSKILCEEHTAIEFAHPERLADPEFNPSAEFLQKEVKKKGIQTV
jgi:hypothetical protein